jgi:LAO/AO transport system kinase
MLEERQSAGSHPRDPGGDAGDESEGQAPPAATWSPPIVETVATEGEGVEDLRSAIADHLDHLRDSGELATRRRARQSAQLRRILREDAVAVVEDAITEHGGIDALVDRIENDGADPYRIASSVLSTVVDDHQVASSMDHEKGE